MADDAEGRAGRCPWACSMPAIRPSSTRSGRPTTPPPWPTSPRPGTKIIGRRRAGSCSNTSTDPLNAFRHEGLVKRLFKRAEAAGDDEVMGRFLALLDRSVRRVREGSSRTWTCRGRSRPRARPRRWSRLWRGLGYDRVGSARSPTTRAVPGLRGTRPDRRVIRGPRRSTMPRGRMIADRWTYDALSAQGGRGSRRPTGSSLHGIVLGRQGPRSHSDAGRPPPARQKLRLFSMATRHYLRRRAWRYFRKLGRQHPDRYVAAASKALALYRDEDAADGLALIDNWGLIHDPLPPLARSLVARPVRDGPSPRWPVARRTRPGADLREALGRGAGLGRRSGS